MTTLYLVLLVFAVVFFALEGFRVVATSRFNLVALGLLCWALVVLIQTARAA